MELTERQKLKDENSLLNGGGRQVPGINRDLPVARLKNGLKSCVKTFAKGGQRADKDHISCSTEPYVLRDGVFCTFWFALTATCIG